MSEKYPQNPAEPVRADDAEERHRAVREKKFGEAPDRSAAIDADGDASQGGEFVDQGVRETNE